MVIMEKEGATVWLQCSAAKFSFFVHLLYCCTFLLQPRLVPRGLWR